MGNPGGQPFIQTWLANVHLQLILSSQSFLCIFNICWQNPKHVNYAKFLLWLLYFCDMIYCKNIKLKLDQKSRLAIVSYQNDVVLLYSIVSENIVAERLLWLFLSCENIKVETCKAFFPNIAISDFRLTGENICIEYGKLRAFF